MSTFRERTGPTTIEGTFREVVWLTGDEGKSVVDPLTRTEGVLVRGATDATVAATIVALTEVYDDGVSGQVTSPLDVGGHRDHVTEVDGWVLWWSVGLGYVGLAQRVTDHTQEVT